MFTISRMGLKLTVLLVLSIFLLAPAAYSGEDRLVVKNDSGTTTFAVEDIGAVFSAYSYLAEGGNPGFWLDEIGTGNKGAYFVLDNGIMQVQRRGQSFGGYEAQVMRFDINAPNYAFRLEGNGNVGFGIAKPADPAYPLHMKSGAHVTTGGVWTDASSRDYKQDIRELSVEEALAAFEDLKPMKFKYKLDPTDDQLGFISEDVPALVASKDRKGMSPMDVVAVLTKVVQEQQKTMAALNQRIEELEKGSR